MAQPKRYIATPSGFLMVLRQGDDVFAQIEELMRTETIPSASINGFGFVATACFGYFNFDRGDYDPRNFQDLEITGMIGTLAWKDGAPSIHAHASGGDKQFQLAGPCSRARGREGFVRGHGPSAFSPFAATIGRRGRGKHSSALGARRAGQIDCGHIGTPFSIDI